MPSTPLTNRRQRLAADVLFAVQVLFAAGFCGRQLTHMLANGARGVSIVMCISIEAFVGINLVLALRAHRARPSRVTWQTAFAYAAWTLLSGTNLVVLLRLLLVSRAVAWDHLESATLAAMLLFVAVVVAAARARCANAGDPIVRAWIALGVKGLPQLGQGWKFLVHGGAGFSPSALAFGHVTALVRLGQLWFSIREAAWDRNRRGSVISEIGNEASWVLSTVCWLVWRFGHGVAP